MLDFYDIKTSIEELKKNPIIQQTRNLSIQFLYMQQIGLIARNLDFQVDFETANPFLITKNDLDSDFDALERISFLRKNLCDEVEKSLQLQIFQELLEHGGNITPKIPSIENIQNNLDQNIPLITFLCFLIFLGEKSRIGFSRSGHYRLGGRKFSYFGPVTMRTKHQKRASLILDYCKFPSRLG
ncbi:hypothetical protein KGV52_01195 [Candidatus Gracilibacteria bacterium]|nr:hypothetical protein [Candidatus Gracilibacteria bacterium]